MFPALRAESWPSSGEMGERVRAKNWRVTSLGDPDAWSDALKRGVAMMLACGFPMALRWGPDLIMIYNDAYIAILGDKHPFALGRPLREVWSEINDELGPLSEAILRGERGSFFENDHLWRICRHAGFVEDAYFTISYSPIPDETAPRGIGGVLTTVVETTRRVHDEQALRTLNETLEEEVSHRTRERDRIWQLSEDLLGVSDFAGRFISINPAWTKLLGWSEDEIKHLHVSQLRHPDDASHSEAGRARLAEGVPTVSMKNRFRHKDGSWRWLSWTMTVESGLIYIIGRHITAEKEAAEALRESERQFRLLVAGVSDYALFMLNPQGIVISWNTGAKRIKGYEESEILGQHFSRFYTAQDRAAGAPERALATAALTGTYESEGLRVRKDGSTFWASVVMDAIYDEQGALVGFGKVTRDITERRHAQEALRRAAERLAQSQKLAALSQLTRGIAHDVNNMLTVISGNTEILRRRLIDPAALRAADTIQTATSRGEGLTRQLLTFGRGQSLEPIVIDIAEHLAAFHNVVRSSAREDIALQIDVPDDTWPISVDVPELELAIVNIVINARDAMPSGGMLGISARNVRLEEGNVPDDLSGDFVAVTFRDTGTGIDPIALPKVFEPFFTTKGPDRGSGLGLAQVYGIARQAGGTAVIDSKLGEGTEVSLYLPRANEATPTISTPPSARALAPGSERVLLVEDDPDVQEVACSLLENLGYRAIPVETAAQALDVLASDGDIDLIFTDIVMPGAINGVGLARRVREQYPDVAVLLTSGDASVETEADTSFVLLRKPYRIAALSAALRDALAGRPSVEPPGRY